MIPWWYVIPGSSDFRYINSQDFIKKTNFDFFFLNKHTKINKQSYKFTITDFQRSPETDVKVNLFLYFRSSQQRCSLRKGVFRNFAKLTRKHLCQSLFFNKVADLRPATLLKKKQTLTQVLSCEFCEISKNTFSAEHLRTTASVTWKWQVIYNLRKIYRTWQKILWNGNIYCHEDVYSNYCHYDIMV